MPENCVESGRGESNDGVKTSRGSTHEYAYEGTFRGDDGRSGAVHRDGEKVAHLPAYRDVDSRCYRYGARIAFDVKERGSLVSDLVTDVEYLGRDYEYDEVGEVVYTNGNRLFVAVDGRDEDVEISRKRIWNGGTADVGDELAFDWLRDSQVRRGEVNDGE